tara:strand:+ start:1669 stop:2292 length:624 start_codon:yes stop_codon:yes gene_type:complete
MKMRFFSITWFPLLAYWAFLLAVSNGREFNSSGFYIPFLIYVITSSVFIYLIQNEFQKREKESVSIISKINIILICLSLSSLIILVNTLVAKDFSQWTSLILLIPLVVNFIFYSLTDYQEEQLTIGYEKRNQERKDSITLIKEWKDHLSLLKEKYSSEENLIRESERIENIIDYSSFFRSSESKDLFEKVKTTTNIEKLVSLLKKVT